MAGSPIRRARKLGLPLPNRGERPPKNASSARARARARGPLPADAELASIGKRVLLEIATDETADPRERVRAAQVLTALVPLRTEAPDDDKPDDLARYSLDELRCMRNRLTEARHDGGEP